MYKTLIVVMTLTILSGGAFYFQKMGVPSLLTSDITNKGAPTTTGVSAAEVFSGSYVCDETDGCKNTTKLMLGQDATLDIVAIIEGQEVSFGQGTWGVGNNGSLVLVLYNTGQAPDGSPKSLIAKKISTLKITGFSEKKGLFPGMENPTFVRVQSDARTAQSDN